MARRKKKAPLQPIVFDTDILIWYLRGHEKARSLLISVDRDRRWISALTLMELLQGCRSKEESLNTQALIAENVSRILHPKTSISEKAIHLLSEYALFHGLRTIDAMIASSALLHRAFLATGNSRHFRFIPGLDILPFKP